MELCPEIFILKKCHVTFPIHKSIGMALCYDARNLRRQKCNGTYVYRGPVSLTEIIWISIMIKEWESNYIHVKQWHAITHPCPSHFKSDGNFVLFSFRSSQSDRSNFLMPLQPSSRYLSMPTYFNLHNLTGNINQTHYGFFHIFVVNALAVVSAANPKGIAGPDKPC